MAAVALVAAGSAGWLALNLRRATLQARQDRDAAERLDNLRAAARQPGYVLLEIHQPQWASSAGQRAWATDTVTGAVGDYWFSGAAFPPGAFVLVQSASGQHAAVLGWLPSGDVASAHRHVRSSSHNGQETAAMRRSRRRRDRAAARAVVQEAERLLRGCR